MPKIDPLDSSAITRVVAVCVSLAAALRQKTRLIVRITGIVLALVRFVSSATLCAVHAP